MMAGLGLLRTWNHGLELEYSGSRTLELSLIDIAPQFEAAMKQLTTVLTIKCCKMRSEHSF